MRNKIPNALVVDSAFKLLDLMLAAARLSAYMHVAQRADGEQIGYGRWLNRSLADQAGYTGPMGQPGSSRASMVAPLKAYEVMYVLPESSSNVVATPLVSRDDRGSGWNGGVGSSDTAVGVSKLAGVHDMLLAYLALFQILNGEVSFQEAVIVLPDENAHHKVYEALYGDGRRPESSDFVGPNAVFIHPATEGVVSGSCVWTIRSSDPDSLLAFVERVDGTLRDGNLVRITAPGASEGLYTNLGLRVVS